MTFTISGINSSRRKTHAVKIGHLYIGSDHSIKTQSMTTTATTDVEATVEQICALAEHNCDIARVTVQGIKEAQAVEKIKERLVALGLEIPLVADIHFFPQAAMLVADFADKVRINPGNYVDKRNMFKGTKIYTEASYAQSLLRLEEKFAPLVEKCKRLGKAMRIGVNHGSLSERIMQKYGDTIEGMVASAIEYIAICERMDYRDVVFSMKSSNPKVMVAAYRQLAKDLDARGWHYPLHLGVTEAGMGMDGIIKSAVGIGTLLAEGLGDTIRCSLTGCPTTEISVCDSLLRQTKIYLDLPEKKNPFSLTHSQSFVAAAEKATKTTLWGDVYGVFLKLYSHHLTDFTPEQLLEQLGVNPITKEKSFTTPEGVVVPPELKEAPITDILREYFLVFHHYQVPCLYEHNEEIWNSSAVHNAPFVHFHASDPFIHTCRDFFEKEGHQGKPTKLVFSRDFDNEEEAAISIGIEFGALLLDGLGEAVVLDLPNISLAAAREIAFGTLQSAGVRLVKTEYISCPMCGRTLFDLEEVTLRIREKTKHLPGLKIAIMGCIVNGPGEMADADFGFVGSKPGMIDLYVKHTCVKAHIPMEDAEEELIRLLQEHGVWKDPDSTRFKA
ncbi:4-hydroxy-3-methylbut-2-en-1-yl diphosphate synthase [Candidatus Chlamydia corallus]|uniref:4-hydroxy-3-methylbut-2-en-1-yl diphosphate synthase n=1 Tax=Candidatus Chlamydia corallus TaxID=2038470 RepID=UPI000C2FCAE2|nr:4-hydroxy-3-methylbut-2-en-1-yl diphosphate synthase [Candidatus Chlamydia corallus]